MLDIQETLNAELKKIVEWLKANKLSLNIAKTHFMIFQPKKKNCSANIEIHIDDSPIQRIRECKFLGIIIDENLSWRSHIAYLKKKLAKSLGILNKARQSLGRPSLLSLYNSMFLPYISYCIIIWGCASDTVLLPVLKLQKRAIRYIFNLPARASTSNVFHEHNILKLNDLFRYQLGVFMYKYHKKLLPNVFNNFFTYNNSVHSYYTRQSNHLHPPKVKSERTKSFVKYAGCVIWNNILQSINIHVKIPCFKKKLKLFCQNT